MENYILYLMTGRGAITLWLILNFDFTVLPRRLLSSIDAQEGGEL